MAKRKSAAQKSLFPEDMPAPVVHRRTPIAGRIIRRQLTAKTAAESLGEITPGIEIYALTMGRFSLIDAIEHVLEATGPAHVSVSTWTAATADMSFANVLMTDNKILSLRFVVDYSFPSRQPAYFAALRQRFGDESIRLTKNHAKFVLIQNEKWNIVIRTSMNLNECLRLESIEISDDKEMANWLGDVLQQLFANQNDTYSRTPGEFCSRFGEEFGAADVGAEAAADPKYFGDGPTDVDLRRVGISRRC